MFGSDDQPTMLRLEFNVVRRLRVLEQSPGHADTPRIADADNTGWNVSGDLPCSIRAHIFVVRASLRGERY
jgi:hypothetical protein